MNKHEDCPRKFVDFSLTLPENKWPVPERYQQWIDKNYPTPEAAKNNCNYATRRIIEEFPELDVNVGYCNKTLHCWAAFYYEKYGSIIVDPTYRQFEPPRVYQMVADRFLRRDEVELPLGIIWLDGQIILPTDEVKENL